MKLKILLTIPQRDNLAMAAAAMLAGVPGEGDAQLVNFDVLERALHALHPAGEHSQDTEWISVHERLPKFMDTVIALRPNKTAVIVEMTSTPWFRDMYTHWLPMPPLPSDG